MHKRFLFVTGLCTLGLLLSGCIPGSMRLEQPQQQDPIKTRQLSECEDFFAELDRHVKTAKVQDAEYARIDGFPYLRVDRLLSSFREEIVDEDEFNAWLDRLRVLDHKARNKELANLPRTRLAANAMLSTNGVGVQASIANCGSLLRNRDMNVAQKRKALRMKASVPHGYKYTRRVLGLYPISSQFVLLGVNRLHKETARTFAIPVEELPVFGKLITYVPSPDSRALAAEEIASILQRSADNPLSIPELDTQQMEHLFRYFAPIWQIDVLSTDDQIGAPEWQEDTKPLIDIEKAHVYRRVSHARFQGRVLLQLNYQVWFPARPKTGAFDLLGGHLDGIIWRVTLAVNGQPLMYEAVHNCGCYHMYFPTINLRYKGKRFSVEEPLLIPDIAPKLAAGERIVLRISHTSHYLERVSVADTPVAGIPYELVDYDELRSLRLPDGTRRSLFGQNGIVAGTERGERWIFWPMGIPAPGAMRQWGHHATAFVGKRHFDDPYLLEYYFEDRTTH